MPLQIAIIYGRNTRIDVGPLDRPMAGITSAALGLSSALARRGHDVHLFTRSKRPGRQEGVTIHSQATLAEAGVAMEPDALIVIPEILPLVMPVRARARIVWTGNGFERGDVALAAPWRWDSELGPAGETARLYPISLFEAGIDQIVVGSAWQAALLREGAGLPEEKLRVQYLGVPLELFGGPPPPRHPHRLVYASQARRGLEPLLTVFPRIRKAVPDAELYIYGYGGLDEVPPDLRQPDLPGVFWGGRLSKSELAHALRSAGLMVYPSMSTETFCLAVAEAQAAGLPVVTTALSALAERVTDGMDGYLIEGQATDAAYQGRFVSAVVRVLQDESLRARMGAEAARKARALYDWDVIAASWETELLRLTTDRPATTVRLPPNFDFLSPEHLVMTYDSRSVEVPPSLAERWLRENWAIYGCDPQTVPNLGMPRAVTGARP